MATIRKRTWISSGEVKSAWQATYVDQSGKRRSRQFPTKREAAAFLAQAVYEVKRTGIVAVDFYEVPMRA